MTFHYSLLVFLLALSSAASAVGLGDLRGAPNLGEYARLEVPVTGEGTATLDASCFRLVRPAGEGDLPWMKKATFIIRKAVPPVLEIRSDAPLREPIIQIAVRVGCGHDLVREYLVLASPAQEIDPLTKPRAELPAFESSPAVRGSASRVRPLPAESFDTPARLTPGKRGKRSASSGLPDRLLLSTGTEIGEPSLRLATELLSIDSERQVREAQRDILRLEFRMLLAMHEQATTQLEAAEKLRNMEAKLGELQQQATRFAQSVEKGAVPATVPADQPPQPAEALPIPGAPGNVAPAVLPARRTEASSGISEWSLYGVMLGALLGLGGWLIWRNYKQRSQPAAEIEFPLQAPELQVDPRREGERAELGGVVDLAVEPSAMGAPMRVDLEVGANEAQAAPAPLVPAASSPARPLDSVLSMSSTTVDEHFEANPVMELADIMLSFGRVKGAAQALQEYIDHNPQEALQPWIRLMDVYRMAGMRTEFEAVARNLNQNFNVEVQQWEPLPSSQGAVEFGLETLIPPIGAIPAAGKPESLEDMPRLMAMVIELWGSGDVVGYLYQLLRDNRGGQRVGFALPVVEEILFLIELKETATRMEKEHAIP